MCIKGKKMGVSGISKPSSGRPHADKPGSGRNPQNMKTSQNFASKPSNAGEITAGHVGPQQGVNASNAGGAGNFKPGRRADEAGRGSNGSSTPRGGGPKQGKKEDAAASGGIGASGATQGSGQPSRPNERSNKSNQTTTKSKNKKGGDEENKDASAVGDHGDDAYPDVNLGGVYDAVVSGVSMFDAPEPRHDSPGHAHVISASSV